MHLHEYGEEQMKRIGSYGISFLDDYLGGIKRYDFVMLGALSGAGKSHLAYQIAFSNAEMRDVHLFALEAYREEPFIRKLFIEYSGWLKSEFGRYADYMGFLRGEVAYPQKVEEIENMLANKYCKLRVHYGELGFTPEMLMQKLEEIASTDNCDMIIIDHIDFFDLHPDQSENNQITDIMRLLLRINLKWKVPIVVVSHLRKKVTRKTKIPDVDDIIGTSNKAKIAKTVILLSPDYATSDPKAGIFSTFITIPKDRMRGGTHLIGKCFFNSGSGCYDKRYKLLTSKDFGESVEELSELSYPAWSEHKETPSIIEPYMLTMGTHTRIRVGESHD